MKILEGDCYDHLLEMEENSIDSVVTDPPYGLSKIPDASRMLSDWLQDEKFEHTGSGGFMGKKWDNFVPGPRIWKEVFRVLKPGGHALVFAAPRTVDLMGLALRLAGFEIRDCLVWIRGQGMPKNHDISKALDKLHGAEREVLRVEDRRSEYDGRIRKSVATNNNWREFEGRGDVKPHTIRKVTKPATEDAERWEGWGTALRPLQEPILLVRKPPEGTLASNVLEHGTGGLNIDATRIPLQDHENAKSGRWPPNAVFEHIDMLKCQYCDGSGEVPGWEHLDCRPCDGLGFIPGCEKFDDGWHCVEQCPIHQLDLQTGNRPGCKSPSNATSESLYRPGQGDYAKQGPIYGDEGGASRYFYCAKASTKERYFYCEDCEQVFPLTKRKEHHNHNNMQHPTVKPVKIMEWLVHLITPPNGVILDPFSGTGTTGVAANKNNFQFVGCELQPEFVKIIKHRMGVESEEEPMQPSEKSKEESSESSLMRMFGG